MKSVRFISVKCVQPSSGTSGTVRDIVTTVGGAGGAYAGGMGGAVLGVATGGALIFLIAGGVVGGAGVGATVTRLLLDTGDKVFSGKDDLYILVNGEKMWPSDSKYQGVDSQNVVELNRTYSLSSPVRIELMEYDYISSDDNMGGIEIDPRHQVGYQRYATLHPEHGSHYEIEYEVTD